MANRNSERLLTFLGAEVSATDVNSAFVNRFRLGQGGEQTTPAGRDRFQGQQVTNAYVPIDEYHIAVAHLTRRGAEPLAARTMGLIFVDVARLLNTSVQGLLNSLTEEQQGLFESATYTYLNTLRQNTTQLTGTNNVTNAQSFRARYLLP